MMIINTLLTIVNPQILKLLCQLGRGEVEGLLSPHHHQVLLGHALDAESALSSTRFKSVVGVVKSGKSSLLSAVLGVMEKTNGTINKSEDSVAYMLDVGSKQVGAQQYSV